MEKYANRVIDLTQDGLAMMFRDYQVLMLKHLWLPHKEASTRELHEAVNEMLPKQDSGRDAISRASIINTGRRFADEGIWDFKEVPAKGGHHRVYHAKITESEVWKAVKDLAVQKLDAR